MDMQERYGQNAQSGQSAGPRNIEGLLGVAMEKLGGMMQVNTVVGEPVLAGGTTIIPISKVSLGFVAGGGEYGLKNQGPAFGGGSGGGVSVAPVGFLTSERDGALRYIPVGGQEPLEKLLDMTPGLLSKLEELLKSGNKPGNNKEDKGRVAPALA